MDGFIVESEQFNKNISDLNPGIIGEPILKSLREQRRKNVLCDVSIECENQQIKAHRCVLYAMSEYCRTLFTGSIPPSYRNGMIVMDLNLFSLDTVQIFIGLLYGEESSEVSHIDIGELMRLFDYLQVHRDILAQILRKIVDAENYMKLNELALSYHLKQLPLMLEPVLISYNERLAKPCRQSIIVTVNDNSQVARYRQRGIIQYDYCRNIIYFVFNHELYAIERVGPHNQIIDYVICKYDQKERRFDKLVSLFERINESNRSGYEDEESVPQAQILMVVSDTSEEYILILFRQYGNFLLMQMNLIKASKPTVLPIDISTAMGYECILYNRNIYFLNASEYLTYNLDSKLLTTRHKLEAFSSDYRLKLAYCLFQERIYAITYLRTDDLMRIYSLDEQEGCWIAHSEHDIEKELITIKDIRAVTSPNEMFVILDVNNTREKYKHDNDMTYIYSYEPSNKSFVIWKKFKFEPYKQYMFIPGHLFE